MKKRIRVSTKNGEQRETREQNNADYLKATGGLVTAIKHSVSLRQNN